MVYPGRPSTGCQTCRSRRIKCDEARPHCNACVNSGRVCPGYPHPLDVVLRPHRAFNRRSGNATQSPRRDVGTASESTSPKSTSSGLFPLPWYSPPADEVVSPQVPSGLYLPMEDTVTALFFNSYLYSPRDPLIRPGSMELLPQMYGSAPFDSHLRMSALAVAFFGVAAWTRQENLLQSAQQFFGKALARTRQALQGNIEENYDQILMTLTLLYLYEEFLSIKEDKPLQKHHLRGAIAFINSYSPERRTSPLSDTLKNAIQAEIIQAAVRSPSLPLRAPETWPLSPVQPGLASSRLMTISAALVKLQERWLEFSAEVADLDEVESILSEARSIDQELFAWSCSLPRHWNPVPATFFPQSVRDAGSYQGRCDCYTDLWIADTWNYYRIFRLTIQNIISRCLSLASKPVDEVEAAAETTRSLAIDICASVPFYMGSQTGSVPLTDNRIEYPSAENQTPQKTAPFISGWLIRPSLVSLCSVENLPEDILHWAGEQVQRVQHIYTSGLIPQEQ